MKQRFNWYYLILVTSDKNFKMEIGGAGDDADSLGWSYEEMSALVEQRAIELFTKNPNLHWIEYYAGYKGHHHYKMSTYYRRDFASRYGFKY